MSPAAFKKGQGSAAFVGGTGFAAPVLGAAGSGTVSPEPPRGPGMIVRLSRIAGLTKPGLLEQPFHFQIAPIDAFRRAGTAEWSDFATLGGPTSRPALASLEEFTFRSLFVDYDPPWAAYHYGTNSTRQAGRSLPPAAPVDPLAWSQDLRDIRDSLTPVALLVGVPAVWGAWHVKNLPVTLRTISEEIPAGEDDVIYFDLSLTEFRQTRLSTATLGSANPRVPATVTVDDLGNARWKDASGSHTIKTATLHELSTRFYGSSSKWKTITRHARNRNLASFAPSRQLDDYARKHGKRSGSRKVANIYIPEPS